MANAPVTSKEHRAKRSASRTAPQPGGARRTLCALQNETPAEPFRHGFERRIVHTPNLLMVVIDISNGPWLEADPFHAHPHEQITYVAEGEILFLAEGDLPRRLKPGDLFAVPSGVPHSIQLLSPRARLIDAFHPVREDFVR